MAMTGTEIPQESQMEAVFSSYIHSGQGDILCYNLSEKCETFQKSLIAEICQKTFLDKYLWKSQNGYDVQLQPVCVT